MLLEQLKDQFSICKIRDFSEIQFHQIPMFIGYTDEEISIVCKSESMPHNWIERDDGWSCIRICGKLDFSEIGIIARIADILANLKIGIFVVSTFNTDYFLIKKEHLEYAAKALVEQGYRFSDESHDL